MATKLHKFRKEKQKIKTYSIQKYQSSRGFIRFSSYSTIGVISGAFLDISGHMAYCNDPIRCTRLEFQYQIIRLYLTSYQMFKLYESRIMKTRPFSSGFFFSHLAKSKYKMPKIKIPKKILLWPLNLNYFSNKKQKIKTCSTQKINQSSRRFSSFFFWHY